MKNATESKTYDGGTVILNSLFFFPFLQVGWIFVVAFMIIVFVASFPFPKSSSEFVFSVALRLARMTKANSNTAATTKLKQTKMYSPIRFIVDAEGLSD